MKAVLLVSHGSRSPKTKEEVGQLTAKLQGRVDAGIIRFAFLELEKPDIPEGIRDCVEAGADEVFLLMNFLNAGRHTDEDIPAILKEQQKKYPGIKLRMSKPVGQHAGIVDLFVELSRS